MNRTLAEPDLQVTPSGSLAAVTSPWADDDADLTAIALDAGRLGTLTLADGRLMTYAEYGDRRGKPVIELHGGGASHLSGVAYHREARESGVRIIAVSRPGAAGSTLHDAFTVASYYRDICELADQLGLDRFAVMGNSNGGMFVLALAHALPDRVVGALPLNPATPAIDDPQALVLVPVYRDLFAAGPEALIASTRGTLTRALKDHEVAFAPPYFAFARTTEPEIIDLYFRALHLAQPAALEREVSFLFTTWGFDLNDIKPPVAFLSGDSEIGTPYNVLWASRLPRATVHTPQGGHMSHLAPDQRRWLMERVLEFHRTAE